MYTLLRLLLIIPVCLFAREEILNLGDLGCVRYDMQDERILKVTRISPEGDELYSHGYNYDEEGNLLSESLIGGLGEIVYHNDGSVSTPFKRQKEAPLREFAKRDCDYDERGCLVRSGTTFYEYDNKLQLVKVSSEKGEVHYTYDDQGKRISREEDEIVEYFGYAGVNDLCISSNEQTKQLRIPGISFHPQVVRAIAIETNENTYAPIHNHTGNIIQLIDIHSHEVIDLGNEDAYGREIPINAPTSWIFSGKHYDASTDLVYFGERYYSPSLKQWLTPDPMKQVPGKPYEYCLNDPSRYFDPNGNWAIAIPLTIKASAWAYAIGSALVSYIVPKTADYLNKEIERTQKEKELKRLTWEIDGVRPEGIGIHAEIDKLEYDQWQKNRTMERSKKKNYSDNVKDEKEMERDDNYKDISRPEALERGHRTFEDKRTGVKTRRDQGKPGKPGHEGQDHYHQYNPNRTNKLDEYLDKNGNPCPRGSEESHLYPRGE